MIRRPLQVEVGIRSHHGCIFQEVTYGSGLFGGDQVIDTFSVGDLTIPQQTFASARFSEGFTGFDGILGLGPTGLTNGEPKCLRVGIDIDNCLRHEHATRRIDSDCD